MAAVDREIAMEGAKLERYLVEAEAVGGPAHHMRPVAALASTTSPQRPEPVTPPRPQHGVATGGGMVSDGSPHGSRGVKVSAKDVDAICDMLLEDILTSDPELDRQIEQRASRMSLRLPRPDATTWDVAAPSSPPSKAPSSSPRSRSPSPTPVSGSSGDAVATDQASVLALGRKVVAWFIQHGCQARTLPLQWDDLKDIMTLPGQLATEEQRIHNELTFDCVNTILMDMYAPPEPAFRPWRSSFGAPAKRPPPQSELEGAVLKRLAELSKFQHAPEGDLIDAVIAEQIEATEPGWVDYEDETAGVRLVLADSLFDGLVAEAVDAMCTVAMKKSRHASAGIGADH
eukprot:m.77884 g.77884  ORF g.77884 m.77884 type:complete len:344 (+) comp9171_c1_seq1:1372-2403(+)